MEEFFSMIAVPSCPLSPKTAHDRGWFDERRTEDSLMKNNGAVKPQSKSG
jgi:hypothetical protein